MHTPVIAVLGTFDTKGAELRCVSDLIRQKGFEVLTVDVGSGSPSAPVDCSAPMVAEHGGEDWRGVLERRDRGEWVALMARAAAVFARALLDAGRIHGILSLGGGGGTAMATAAMRALPVGFPKVMVSTLASGNVAPYVGLKDVVMMPSIVDVAGVNRISRVIFENAAGAVCGMVAAAVERAQRREGERPLVVASMFGNTTECVEEARRILEQAGCEVLVFHSTGQGGRAMEALIAGGLVAGVLDVTTTEWADEYVGGILSAGPERLDAAAKAGIPTVIAPGCLDMVNFGEWHTVPERFAGRTLYAHNPQVTLMRTSPEESLAIGRILAGKINAYRGSVQVLWPGGGISRLSEPGQPFHLPEADAALLRGLRERLDDGVELRELPYAINDPDFASACAEALLGGMGLRRP
jgi:uncharacterized protein (UPF0261 family)